MKKKILLFILGLGMASICLAIQPEKIDTSKYVQQFYLDLYAKKIKLYGKPISETNIILQSVSLNYYLNGKAPSTWFKVKFINPIKPQEKEDMGNLKVISADIIYKPNSIIEVSPIIGVPL